MGGEGGESDGLAEAGRRGWVKGGRGAGQGSGLGKNKALGWRLGYLGENEMNTLWRILKDRYAQRGYDLDAFNELNRQPMAHQKQNCKCGAQIINEHGIKTKIVRINANNTA